MASERGEGEAGRDFEPTAPECDEGGQTAELERGPVTHGTPLERGEYERLKERARTEKPRRKGRPAQQDR